MTDHTGPPRIYLRPECCADPTWGREWARQPGEGCEEGVPWTPYVRADWQPIATAPRDGTAVLLFDPDTGLPFPARFRVDVTGWGNPGEWMDWHGMRLIAPTHWMPLPELPEDGS